MNFETIVRRKQGMKEKNGPGKTRVVRRSFVWLNLDLFRTRVRKRAKVSFE